LAEENERELQEKIEAELKRLKVSDVLVSTVYTVSSLGYRRLSQEDRDLDQAKLAIEALRALVPVLADSVAEGTLGDFNQVVANMQLAYAAAVAKSQSRSEEAEQEADGGS
jgi:hypothetical protein